MVLFKEKREINLRMGILEDLLGFVWESKDRKTLQKIVKKLRDKIKKTELDDVTKGIMMGELDWIDKHYHITREEHGFDESKVGECFEKLEDFVKRNADIFKEGRVADERFKIPFSGKTSGEIRELETREEWLKKSMKKEWLTKEQEEWESKIKNCKDIYSLTRIEKELEREMQKHGGLPGNDYWIYHGTPTYPGLKKLIENKKEELEELLGRAFKSKTIREKDIKATDRQLLKERIKKVGHGIKYPFVKGKIPTCPRCGSKNIKPPGPGELGVYTCLDCKYKFYRGEEYQPPLKRLFKRGKTKIYEGKPSKNVEEYAKIILSFVAIGIGIAILIVSPGLWIIGIPAIIIGIGYLLIVAPEMDKFSFKQKVGVLIIITGGLLAFVFGVIWYGLALLFLGGAFIFYDWIPKRKGRLAIKIIELGATLALLILVVPAFLNWAGISISLGALALFSGLNTFLLFLLWSWSEGKSIKESLEEELLKKQIEEIEVRKKAEETQIKNAKKNNKEEESLKTVIEKINVNREKGEKNETEKNNEEGEQK